MRDRVLTAIVMWTVFALGFVVFALLLPTEPLPVLDNLMCHPDQNAICASVYRN